MERVLIVLALAIGATTGSLAKASPAAEQLTITVRGGELGDRAYTLGCDPAAGTVTDPTAACATLRAHPDLLEPHPGQDHSCPPDTPTYEIAGTFGGAAVAASFSACVSGQEDGLEAWERLVRYKVPLLHGRPRLKVDAGVGPLRLGRRVETVEHEAHGQLLGDTWVLYELAHHGVLYTHYGRDLRIDRIKAAIRVDLGTAHVSHWRHFNCRPGRVYRHTTGAKWTVVLSTGTPPKGVWQVIIAAGAAPKTCDALSLAPLRHQGSEL
jgi:hypothetical protein